MNNWLQTKGYTYSQCGARYLHDKEYLHALFFYANWEPAKR